ncbi:hypothetical protein ACJX0J_016816, partial [Zea mays]
NYSDWIQPGVLPSSFECSDPVGQESVLNIQGMLALILAETQDIELIQVKGHIFETDAYVLSFGAYDMILGMDWLEDFSPMLAFFRWDMGFGFGTGLPAQIQKLEYDHVIFLLPGSAPAGTRDAFFWYYYKEKLNELMVKNKFPMPVIDEFLDELLDMASGKSVLIFMDDILTHRLSWFDWHYGILAKPLTSLLQHKINGDVMFRGDLFPYDNDLGSQRSPCAKLAFKYFGPYKILEKIGAAPHNSSDWAVEIMTGNKIPTIWSSALHAIAIFMNNGLCYRSKVKRFEGFLGLSKA